MTIHKSKTGTSTGGGTTPGPTTQPGGHTTQPGGHRPIQGTGGQPVMSPLLRELRDGKLAGMELHRDKIRVALDIPADGLTKTALLLGRVGGRLPHGVLTPQDRPIYARMRYQGQDEFVNKTAVGLRASKFVPAEGTTADQLDELTSRKEQYRGFEVLGDLVKTVGLDLRLTYGTFQWFMIDRVLGYVEKRFADPKLPPAENRALLNDFGPLLIEIDDMLRKGPENKEALFQRRLEAGAQAQEALAEAAMAETIYQLHTGQTPEREALVAAARRYFAQHPEALPANKGAGSAHQVDPNRPKTGPRKVIR